MVFGTPKVNNPRKPTKLGVVRDCAEIFQGRSLNGYLYQGFDTTAYLTGVMLRFPRESVAIVADISEMIEI